MSAPRSRSLSAKDVAALVGPLDESVILAVLDTGATAAEIAEARRLAEKTDQPIPPPTGVGRAPFVHKVYDILRVDLGERHER
ncbi:MAG: hypothetical protein EXQ85_00045 [Alphaproteobacteria bacterium]|nr:hypothetical protein [Alphaproteobacteria bacterium]